MYYDYFGFKQAPFKITPDTNLFFPGGDRGAVLEALIYAILNGEGIVKVVGEVGSGKTMLCRMLEKELPDKVDIVYLANPKLSPENTLHAIAFELKLPIKPDTSRLQVMTDLQQYLVQRHAENKQVVVFVEEAQGMPLGTLEEIRLLSNLETQQNKLLQIVLFGQPELDEMIATPEIRQLKERITYSFQLKPFKTSDIQDYITTRLRACGYRTGGLFSPAAIKAIERYSQGLVRRINILADKSLLAAYAATCQVVTDKHVFQAARDSEFVVGAKPKRKLFFMATAIGLMLLAGFGGWLIAQHTTSRLSVDKSVQADVIRQPESTQQIVEVEDKVSPQLDNAEQNSTNVSTRKHEYPATEILSTETEAEEEFTEITDSYDDIDNRVTEPQAVSAVITEEEIDRQLGIEIAVSKADTEEQTSQPLVEEQASPLLRQADEPERAELASQLLGMTAVYQLQDLGDSKLSDRESYIINKQLQRLPPAEVKLKGQKSLTGDICSYCWAIIYRPLIDPENL